MKTYGIEPHQANSSASFLTIVALKVPMAKCASMGSLATSWREVAGAIGVTFLIKPSGDHFGNSAKLRN